MREKAVVVAPDEDHPHSMKVPCLDGEWVILSLSSAEVFIIAFLSIVFSPFPLPIHIYVYSCSVNEWFFNVWSSIFRASNAFLLKPILTASPVVFLPHVIHRGGGDGWEGHIYIYRERERERERKREMGILLGGFSSQKSEQLGGERAFEGPRWPHCIRHCCHFSGLCVLVRALPWLYPIVLCILCTLRP